MEVPAAAAVVVVAVVAPVAPVAAVSALEVAAAAAVVAVAVAAPVAAVVAAPDDGPGGARRRLKCSAAALRSIDPTFGGVNCIDMSASDTHASTGGAFTRRVRPRRFRLRLADREAALDDASSLLPFVRRGVRDVSCHEIKARISQVEQERGIA
jgi:hypothetical protein